MHSWIRGLCAEKIINKESLTALLTAHVMMGNSTSRAHGYGFFIDKKYDRRLIEYSGSLIGYLSRVMHFVDDNITIILLTNVGDHDQFSKIYENIPEILFASSN